jgi:cytochrome c oxidase subunit II
MMDDAPLNYLTGAGLRAYPVVWLTWGMLAISVIVVLVIAYLLVAGLTRRRPAVPPESAASPPVRRPSSGLEWIYVGVGVSTVVLLGSAVWTMYTLAAVGPVPADAKHTIEVTAHQWWWEARYLSDQPSHIFTTANELHIPVGERVLVLLKSSDVIHSFWVPALSGKTDAIPGQTNRTWLQADKAGVYTGQCTEYCGKQHAHMGLRVIADPPQKYDQWVANQLASAQKPAAGSEAAEGEQVFETRCGGCHRVRGTLAGGALGPDLTHLMTRKTIAAGSLRNTPARLSAWIADPQHIKPGTQMPSVDLSGPDLQALRTYLESLS